MSHTGVSSKVDIADLIDNTRIGSFQISLFTLCAMCLIMDGFDVQAMGFVAPEVIREMGMSPAQLGTILAAANFGVLVGSLVFTIIGDKFGRRPVLIAATLFFSLLTTLTALATSPQQLLILRFIGGIGMGSIMPNATAIIGEYSPRRHRIALVMTITVGFTAGAALGGFLAAWMLPRYGWRAVFYFGGAIPAIVGVLMIFQLPESLQFLALTGRRAKLERWVKRMKVIVPANAEYVVSEQTKRGVPIMHLFKDGRASTTTLYWIVNFTNLINLYFLAGLLPTILSRAGYASSTAAMAGAVLQTGGTIGTFVLAWFITKKGFIPALTSSFVIAFAAIALIGRESVLGSVPAWGLVVFLAGACIIGAQPGLNAVGATYYPTYMRSTGVGWALGIGRIGAIIGPYVGGQIMALRWTNQNLFMIFALPALVSAVVMLLLHFTMEQKPDTQYKG